MLIRKALSWEQMVLICSGLLLVETKQCCTPFSQPAIKLDIIYPSVFHRSSLGVKPHSAGHYSLTHRERYGSSLLETQTRSENPTDALTSGYYQILLFLFHTPFLSNMFSSFSLPNSRRPDVVLQQLLTHWLAGHPFREPLSCCSSTVGVAGSGCTSLFCIKTCPVTLSSISALLHQFESCLFGKT